MTTTITVTNDIAALCPSLTAGQTVAFADVMALRSVTDAVVIEYVHATSTWRFIDQNASSTVSSICMWFHDYCSLPLALAPSDSDPALAMAERLLSQLGQLIRPTVNMYISDIELIALLLWSADQYVPSPDPTSDVDVQTHTVTINNVVDAWNDVRDYNAECGGFIYAYDEPHECPIRTLSTWMLIEGDALEITHMLGGNSYTISIWGGSEPPVLSDNGIFVNKDRFTLVARTPDQMGDLRMKNSSGNYITAVQLFGTANMDQNGNLYDFRMYNSYMQVNQNYPHDAGAMTTIRTNSVSIPADRYRYWVFTFDWGTTFNFIPSPVRSASNEYSWMDMHATPDTSFRHYRWSATHNVEGVSTSFYPETKTVASQTTGSVTCGVTRKPWYGFTQSHAVFTPGYTRHWTVNQVRRYYNMAGNRGNTDPTEGPGRAHEPYSTPVDDCVYATSTYYDVDSSTYDNTVQRALLNIDQLIAIDAFNLPNWHTEAAPYARLSQPFAKITANGDPYLQFVASISSAYVARAILENLMLSLTTGIEMEPVFGITDSTPIVVVDPEDPNSDVLTPAQARESSDLDLICANYTDMSLRVDDVLMLQSALNDAESSYQTITDVINGLLNTVSDTLNNMLYRSIDPYAIREALITDAYSNAQGLYEMADTLSAAVAAGASSVSDVINYIETFAPQFSLRFDAKLSVMFNALLSPSQYEGYTGFFTGTDAPRSSASMSWFTKTGAGFLRADTEGEVFDTKVGAMMLWPPLFSGLVQMPTDFVEYFDSVGEGAAFTIPLRHSYVIMRTVNANTCHMLWCARYAGGGDQAAADALQASATEMASFATVVMRELSGDHSLVVTSTSSDDGDIWRPDVASTYDPTTRDLERAVTALTYAGAGALAGAAFGGVGALVGGVVGGVAGVSVAYFLDEDADYDVWDVAAARNLIDIDASHLRIVSTNQTFATDSPDIALIRCLAAYAYVIYRGVWAPMSHPGETPVGYALVTPSIITPRYYQMDPFTDYIPMISTLGAAMAIAGTTMYLKKTKIGTKNQKLTSTFEKDSNGKLIATTELPALSFSTVRARACLPAVAAGGLYGLVDTAVDGVRSAVQSRAQRVYDTKLLRAAQNADKQSLDTSTYIAEAVAPAVAGLEGGVAAVATELGNTHADVQHILNKLQNPIFWPRP